MANVKTKEGWSDLGLFKSKKCKKTMQIMVCELKFTQGTLTLRESELNKICNKK